MRTAGENQLGMGVLPFLNHPWGLDALGLGVVAALMTFLLGPHSPLVLKGGPRAASEPPGFRHRARRARARGGFRGDSGPMGIRSRTRGNRGFLRMQGLPRRGCFRLDSNAAHIRQTPVVGFRPLGDNRIGGALRSSPGAPQVRRRGVDDGEVQTGREIEPLAPPSYLAVRGLTSLA